MDLVSEVLEKARKRADAVEVVMDRSESRSVSFEANRLKFVEEERSLGIGLRVIRNGRIGFSCTSDVAQLDRLIENAAASAEFGEEARFELPPQGEYAEAKIYDENVERFELRRAIEMLQEGVDMILAAHPDVKCDGGIHIGVAERVIANSNGLRRERRRTSLSGSLGALRVEENGGFLSVYDGQSSRNANVCIADCARYVIDTLKKCEKRTGLEVCEMPVLFTPRTVGAAISALTMGADGRLLQKGSSPLADRLGEKIAHESFTYREEPLADWRPGTTPIDGEGLPTRAKPIVDHGVFANFIFDLQTAGLLGKAPTGNGMRGYSSLPSPGYTNVVVAAGDQSLEELLKSVDRLLVVEQTLGAGQSNVLAGEISMNVSVGFLVEKGEVVGRVKDCMVAANVFDAFQRIAGISKERQWRGGSLFPSILFESMRVAGAGR